MGLRDVSLIAGLAARITSITKTSVAVPESMRRVVLWCHEAHDAVVLNAAENAHHGESSGVCALVTPTSVNEISVLLLTGNHRKALRDNRRS